MTDISLVSRVRTTAGTRRNNSKKHCKKQQEDNSGGGGGGSGATSATWRIFAGLDKPKHTLSKMNLTSMQVSMFPPRPIPSGRPGESLSHLASDCSDWGGGGGDEEMNDISG